MEHVGGAFLFLGIGLICAVFVGVLEFIWKVNKIHQALRKVGKEQTTLIPTNTLLNWQRRSPINLGSMLCAQLYFSMQCLAPSSHLPENLPPYRHVLQEIQETDQEQTRDTISEQHFHCDSIEEIAPPAAAATDQQHAAQQQGQYYVWGWEMPAAAREITSSPMLQLVQQHPHIPHGYCYW